MIKAIIFDKDGTLHNTEKVFEQAWTMAAADLDVPDIATTLHDCTGMTIPAIGAYWAGKYPTIPFDTYIARRQYHFRRIVADGVPVKPGAYELLDYLHDRGYHIGMATSTDALEAMEHLARTDMIRYFDENAIITGDMVKNGKPAPDIYLLAASRMGVDPSLCLGVEDSNNGVRAIHAAGMRPIMIPDIVEPHPEVKALAWQMCASLLDIIPILEREAE